MAIRPAAVRAKAMAELKIYIIMAGDFFFCSQIVSNCELCNKIPMILTYILLTYSVCLSIFWPVILFISMNIKGKHFRLFYGKKTTKYFTHNMMCVVPWVLLCGCAWVAAWVATFPPTKTRYATVVVT